MKQRNILFSLMAAVTLALGTGLLTVSCDDWTETESLAIAPQLPEDQNPELYARYAQAIRDYKARTHYLVFARFDNGRSDNAGEQNYLRSLPDSLDAVILEHADALTEADLEDFPPLQQNFDTKVMASFNLSTIYDEAVSAGKKAATEVSTALDRLFTIINEHNLDGASIIYTGNLAINSNDPDYTSVSEMRRTLLDKLIQQAKTGKTFYLEADPLFIPQADRDAFSYYILNTVSADNISRLHSQIQQATGYVGIAADRLLITTNPDKTVMVDMKAVDQLPAFTQQVIDAGPVKGLLIQNVIADYAHANATYQETRKSIQTLNPSPLK